MRSLVSLLLLALPAIADVPMGEVLKFTFEKSKVFPGTTRDVWVYVPKQYDGKTPASLHVNQDGIQFNAVKMKDGKPVEGGVFDKLIAEKKMPVTIGVFVRPGVVKAVLPNALDRFNRSYEYDGLGPDYAKFLIDELLPHVETLAASDGRKIKLSRDPNDRAIGGSSSGAICAFTVAWERPDSFRRVFSSIGTYVGLRGGNEYSTLIRKVEPKPLRIFLEDGSNDLNIYGGDWWIANQSMERSLKFMGYEVEHNWGTGGHSGQHATEIFPEALTWLWKDWPNPVKTGECKNDFLKDILIPGEGWTQIGESFTGLRGIVANDKGIVYLSDGEKESTYIVTDGKPVKWKTNTAEVIYQFQCYGPNRKIYATERAAGLPGGFAGEFVCINDEGKSSPVKDGTSSTSSIALKNGTVYFSLHTFLNADRDDLYCIDAGGEVMKVGRKLSEGEAVLAVSPDQSLLYSHDVQSHIVYSYQILNDGKLSKGQKFFHLHKPDDLQNPSRGEMRCDRDGRLWIATSIGLQVCDQAGRVHCILPTPNGKCDGLAFGGPEFNVLYVACGDKVYSRKVKVKGANAFEPPITPKKPNL